MKKVMLVVCMVPLLASAAMLPTNVIVEMGTATWCGYCPNAYAGLEVMKSEYPVPDLACVRYYASSGDYGSQEIDSRIAYYAVQGYPTVIFNGTERVVGAGSDAVDGHLYDPIISSILLEETTPFKMSVELEIGGDSVTAITNLELFEDYTGSTPKLRVAVIEDDVSGHHTNVTRRVVTVDEVTITNQGEEQLLGQAFELDPGWDTGNLYAVAFLQVEGTRKILQVASTYPQPDYHFRVSAASENYRIQRIDPGQSFTASFLLTNVGTQPDDYNLFLDDSDLPSGWNADIVLPTTMAVDPYQGFPFSVEISPNGNTGQGEVVLQVSSDQGGESWELPIRAITNDVDINIVDDDGGEDFEGYFTAALDAMGKTYGVWNSDAAAFHLDNLADDMSPVLIWSCGWSFPSLDKDQRDLLGYYLDNGGKLFLTGQDIGWDLCDFDSENATNDSREFYNDYLHAEYLSDDADDTDISGITGDPVTDGMNFAIAGGDGADNQEYPSVIRPYDEYSTSILTYSTGDTAAIRAEDGYKLVYLAFGYEAIDNAADRRELLENALDWLGPAPPMNAVSESSPPTPGLSLEIETLVTGSLRASYLIPAPQGRIEVFDALGRRVAGTRLEENHGSVSIDLKGQPAGCYFVRLESRGRSSTQKAVLIR